MNFVNIQTFSPSEGIFVLIMPVPTLPLKSPVLCHPPKQTLGSNPPIQNTRVNPVLTQGHSPDLTLTVVKAPWVLSSPLKSPSKGFQGSVAFANDCPSFCVPTV